MRAQPSIRRRVPLEESTAAIVQRWSLEELLAIVHQGAATSHSQPPIPTVQ